MPRSFNSVPANLVVQAPPALGKGSNAGTYSNDVWTPGRDAAGIVNEVSWALVPKGRWVSVAGTRLDALDSVVKAALPGWRDLGNSRWVGVTNAWNSVAMDPANARAWWVASGGHSDSSNNGIYRFDGFKMVYAIERLPTDISQWSQAYRNGCVSGTSTICGESDNEKIAAVSAGTWNRRNGWLYDELYWSNPTIDAAATDVGVPTARHVYNGVAYLPDRGELVMASRRVWRYSLASGKWTMKNAPGRSNSNGGDGGLEEEIILQYDQSRSLMTMVSCGSGTPWFGSYNLNTDTWDSYRPPGYGWEWDTAAAYRHGDEATIIKTADPTARNPKTGQYVKYNITTRATVASGATQYGGGLTEASFAAGWDGQGMVYIPTLNRYWVTARMTTNGGGYQWLDMDPTTVGGWTMSPKTFANTAPTPIHCNHAMYVPSLDAVLWLGQADQDIQIYRV